MPDMPATQESSSGLRTEARRLLEGKWKAACRRWVETGCGGDLMRAGDEIFRALLAEGEPTEGQEKADGLRDVQPVLTPEPEATASIRRECYLAGLILPDGEWSHE